jgi:hypothetical protein
MKLGCFWSNSSIKDGERIVCGLICLEELRNIIEWIQSVKPIAGPRLKLGSSGYKEGLLPVGRHTVKCWCHIGSPFDLTDSEILTAHWGNSNRYSRIFVSFVLYTYDVRLTSILMIKNPPRWSEFDSLTAILTLLHSCPRKIVTVTL